MAKITKKEERTVSKDEALSIIKNADGRVRFQVHVHAFLPTTEDRGFEGSTCISVSRADMLKVIESMVSDVLVERGAKVRLHFAPADYKDGLSFISLY